MSIQPPKKRPTRRFEKPEDIEFEITRLQAKAGKEAIQAEGMDKEADALFFKYREIDVDKLEGMRLQEYRIDFHKANNLRRSAEELRNRQYLNKNRLEHLKRTLAEARTMVLPGMLPDNSVAMDRYLK
jgi:hypothetical protein